MAKFRVKPGQKLTYGEKGKDPVTYQGGDEVEMTVAMAATIPWSVDRVSEKAEEKK